MSISLGLSPKVALVIPALNEAESIVSVIAAVIPYGQPIVVDDGSTDGTGELARTAGALVVTHRVNRGYDEALASGLSYAIKEGFELAITMDADGQHQPSILSEFLAKLVDGADVVIGERDRHQRFSESVFSFGAKLLWGISDPLCGMKGYRLGLFSGLASLSTYRSIGTELATRARRSKCRIDQVPIVTLARRGASRFGSGLRANWLILNAMFVGLVSARSLSTTRSTL